MVEAQAIVFHDYIYTLPPEVANEPNPYLSSIVQDFLTPLVFRLLFCWYWTSQYRQSPEERIKARSISKTE